MAQEAIFIGYRRDDTADVAGRIFDALAQRFGKSRLFKDVDNIPPGADFGAYIQTVLPRCRVALILIGPDWLEARDEAGNRRLDDPHDWVRVEIETALKTDGIDVVPVLVNGASMPRAQELPENLHVLLRRNAAVIRRDPDFHDDVDRLATALSSSVQTGMLDLATLGGERKATAMRAGAAIPAFKFDAKRYVFISYPKDIDTALMRTIIRSLLKRRIGVWVYDTAPFGLTEAERPAVSRQHAAKDFTQQSLKALEEASCVLLLLGRATAGSAFQSREVDVALSRQRYVAAKVDDIAYAELRTMFADKHVPDLNPRSNTDEIVRQRVEDLADDVAAVVSQRRRPAALASSATSTPPSRHWLAFIASTAIFAAIVLGYVYWPRGASLGGTIWEGDVVVGSQSTGMRVRFNADGRPEIQLSGYAFAGERGRWTQAGQVVDFDDDSNHFHGTIVGDRLSGSYSSPNGEGTFSFERSQR